MRRLRMRSELLRRVSSLSTASLKKLKSTVAYYELLLRVIRKVGTAIHALGLASAHCDIHAHVEIDGRTRRPQHGGTIGHDGIDCLPALLFVHLFTGGAQTDESHGIQSHVVAAVVEMDFVRNSF
jgi:hypothetical protein